MPWASRDWIIHSDGSVIAPNFCRLKFVFIWAVGVLFFYGHCISNGGGSLVREDLLRVTVIAKDKAASAICKCV